MRLEWVTLAYMTSAIAVLALVLGQSQAMKAAWVEDVLGLLPPLAFLIALRYDRRDPDESFQGALRRRGDERGRLDDGAGGHRGDRGIGAGLWWADAVAAILISPDIVRDGFTNLRTAVADLMDRRPMTYDHKKPLDLVPRMQERVSRLPQVAEADVRLREQGHAVTGEVFVVPRDPSAPGAWLTETVMREVHQVDWRLHEVTVVRWRRWRIRREPDGARTPAETDAADTSGGG